MRSRPFFWVAPSIAAIVATCSVCFAEFEDGPLNYLPSNTIFALRAGDVIGGLLGDASAVLRRAARAPEQVGIDEAAGMLASAGAMSGVDLNGEIVVAVTMSERTGAPTLPIVGSIFASPQLSLLLLLPCRDVNALPMALGMAGYSPDGSTGGSGGLLLVHDSLPTLALSQWAPGVVAAAVAAAPLRPGEAVEGPGACSLAAGSGCSVVAVNADGTVTVRAVQGSTYTMPAAALTRGRSDALLDVALAGLVDVLPAPLRSLLPMLRTLLPLGRVPPPALPAADARLRLPRALRAAARNSAVSLVVHPRGADPALRPLLAALRSGSPLLRMAAAAGLGMPPVPAAAASALGALIDAAIDGGLTVLEDTDAIVLALGRSTGFGLETSLGTDGRATGSGGPAADGSGVVTPPGPGNTAVAAAAAPGAAAGLAGIRFEATLAARRNTSLSRAFAAAPASAPWEDLLVGLPASVPDASYIAVSGSVDPSVSGSDDAASATDSSAAAASSFFRGVADAAAAALAPHVRSLQSDASPLSRLLLLLVAEDGGIVPAAARLLEGAQLAVVQSEPASDSTSATSGGTSAQHGFAALLPGIGASTAAALLRLHSAAAQAAALAVDSSMPWAAGWLPADNAAAASSAQVALSVTAAGSSSPVTSVTFPLAGAAAALGATLPSLTFSSSAQQSVAGVSFERRSIMITASLSNASASAATDGAAGPSSFLPRLLLQLLKQHHGSMSLDVHVGVIPETQQGIAFAGLGDAAAAAFIEAARGRPAAIAAARAAVAAVAAERQRADAADAADAAEDDGAGDAPAFNFEEAGLDPEMAAAFASAISAAADRAKDGGDGSGSTGSGGNLRRELEDADNPYGDSGAGRAVPPEAAAAVPSGGYSARSDVAAAARAAHPRRSSIATIQLRSAASAVCAAMRASASFEWLADICSAAADALSAASPMTASTAVDGTIASLRLAMPVPTLGA